MVFVTSGTIYDWSWQFSFVFNVDHTCSIGHIIILSGFYHKLHPIQLVMTTQFCFYHRSHLCNQSCCSFVWFSSLTTPVWIGPNSSISILALTIPIRSVMLLPCLVFIIDCTRSDRSQQLSFVFSIDHTCIICHSIVLSGFHHRSYYVR